jgi:hypothetical protein
MKSLPLEPQRTGSFEQKGSHVGGKVGGWTKNAVHLFSLESAVTPTGSHGQSYENRGKTYENA